jgi:hypothetical protein
MEPSENPYKDTEAVAESLAAMIKKELTSIHATRGI